MSILLRVTCFIALSLLLCLPAAAQDNTNPLLNMLRLVPDNEQTRAGVPLVGYIDYREIEVARGIMRSISKADFDNHTDKADLWIAATNAVTSGLRLDYLMQYLEGMEQTVGFSWGDIDRALVFGNPPSTGNVITLSGGFEAADVVNAFEARNYTVENQDNVTVLCALSGCEAGLKTNLMNRNPANPFGGELGREEPVALLPGNTLANSADYTVLSAILETYQGEQPSLADDPNILAAVNVIAGKGRLRQTQFLNGADIGDYGDMVASEGEKPVFLPVYSLVFFADTYEGDEQSALIGLVYDDEQSATTAATMLTGHLQMAQSLAVRRRFREMIEERGGNIIGATVETDAETGKSIALLNIVYPMPSNERLDGNYVASSLVFRLLIESIYRRDASWLAADFAGSQ